MGYAAERVELPRVASDTVAAEVQARTAADIEDRRLDPQ